MTPVLVRPIKIIGYCRHVLNIPRNEIDSYIKLNLTQITHDINTMVMNGQLIFNGCHRSSRTGKYDSKARAYFISGRMLIITDSEVTDLWGIRRIDMNELNRLQKKLKPEELNDIHTYISLLIKSTENWYVD